MMSIDIAADHQAACGVHGQCTSARAQRTTAPVERAGCQYGAGTTQCACRQIEVVQRRGQVEIQRTAGHIDKAGRRKAARARAVDIDRTITETQCARAAECRIRKGKGAAAKIQCAATGRQAAASACTTTPQSQRAALHIDAAGIVERHIDARRCSAVSGDAAIIGKSVRTKTVHRAGRGDVQRAIVGKGSAVKIHRTTCHRPVIQRTVRVVDQRVTVEMMSIDIAADHQAASGRNSQTATTRSKGAATPVERAIGCYCARTAKRTG